MGSPLTKYLLCASILLSASSVCLAQEEFPKPHGDGARPAVIRGGRLPRREYGEYSAAAPLSWELPVAPLPDFSFTTPRTLDAVFSAPDDLVGGAMHALSRLFHDEGEFDLAEESRRSMTARLAAAIDIGPIDRPFGTFLSLLYERESKYFSRWQESPLATAAVENGDEDVDESGFLREQRKVFVHALGRRYLGRYGDSLDEKLRREAFDFSGWEAADFVVGPAVIAGYLYLRGWEGRVKVGDVDCRMHLLPLERIEGHLQRTEDILVSAASLEISVGDFPLRAVISCGVIDGRPALDFIGLGTSIGMVRKAIRLGSDLDPSER